MTTIRTIMMVLLCAGTISAEAQSSSKYYTGQTTDIHPSGWLKTMLQRQHDGLTGHPEALSYPYNSCFGPARYHDPTRATATTGGAMSRRPTIPKVC